MTQEKERLAKELEESRALISEQENSIRRYRSIVGNQAADIVELKDVDGKSSSEGTTDSNNEWVKVCESLLHFVWQLSFYVFIMKKCKRNMTLDWRLGCFLQSFSASPYGRTKRSSRYGYWEDWWVWRIKTSEGGAWKRGLVFFTEVLVWAQVSFHNTD